MVMSLSTAFAVVINRLVLLAGGNASNGLHGELRHAVECVLRTCINHVNERQDSFVNDRAMLISAIMRRDENGGFDAHEVLKIANWIREAQNEHYAAGEREREARLAELRARAAARREQGAVV